MADDLPPEKLQAIRRILAGTGRGMLASPPRRRDRPQNKCDFGKIWPWVAAQARALLKELFEQVAEISEKIERAERSGHRASIRGAALDRRLQSSLRQELNEVHRLIDGLHHRFPEPLRV